MMHEPVDAQEALEKIIQAQYELQEAFYGFAGWAAKSLVDNRAIPFDAAAEDFRKLAKQAGDKARAIAGSGGRDNPLMLNLAELFDDFAKGTTPSPFGVINGGKANQDD